MKTAREHTDILHSQIQKFGGQVSYNDILKVVIDVFNTCIEVCSSETDKNHMIALRGPEPKP